MIGVVIEGQQLFTLRGAVAVVDGDVRHSRWCVEPWVAPPRPATDVKVF